MITCNNNAWFRHSKPGNRHSSWTREIKVKDSGQYITDVPRCSFKKYKTLEKFKLLQ